MPPHPVYIVQVIRLKHSTSRATPLGLGTIISNKHSSQCCSPGYVRGRGVQEQHPNTALAHYVVCLALTLSYLWVLCALHELDIFKVIFRKHKVGQSIGTLLRTQVPIFILCSPSEVFFVQSGFKSFSLKATLEGHRPGCLAIVNDRNTFYSPTRT